MNFQTTSFLQKHSCANLFTKAFTARMLGVCTFFSILICLFLFESAPVEDFVSFIWAASVTERSFLSLNLGQSPCCDCDVDDADAENEKDMTEEKTKGFFAPI